MIFLNSSKSTLPSSSASANFIMSEITCGGAGNGRSAAARVRRTGRAAHLVGGLRVHLEDGGGELGVVDLPALVGVDLLEGLEESLVRVDAQVARAAAAAEYAVQALPRVGRRRHVAELVGELLALSPDLAGLRLRGGRLGGGGGRLRHERLHLLLESAHRTQCAALWLMVHTTQLGRSSRRPACAPTQ